MSVKVFVLGSPGTGKSTVVRRLLELAENNNYPATRMKDYHILLEMFHEKIYEDKFRKSEHGGFQVLDPAIYDMALKQLEKEVEKEESCAADDEILTIEFARNNYRDAFHKFSASFLENSYFFFLNSSIDTCIDRIHNRITYPHVSDCHFVPDEVVRAYDGSENWPYITQEFIKDFNIRKEIALYRNIGSIDDLYAQVDRFAETIFANEFASLSQKYMGSIKESEHRLAQFPSTDPLLSVIPPFAGYLNPLESL
jgi:adenylate kinase family enzyme